MNLKQNAPPGTALSAALTLGAGEAYGFKGLV